MTITRKDTTISLPDGVELAAWLYVPEGDGPFPAVTMAHGLGGIRQQGLEARSPSGSPRPGTWFRCTITATSGEHRHPPARHRPLAADRGLGAA